MRLVVLLLLAVLTGCAAPPPAPGTTRDAGFAAVVARVEPVAERECRRRNREVDCDFLILVDDRPGAPANALQTLDRRGRPVLVITTSLIRTARNADELAFILGHEAAHHIAGHLELTRISAEVGALVLGGLAEAAGGSGAEIDRAVALGAEIGARRFSQEFELEADALGTVIAHRAGFDPVRGAAFFARIPDPGDRFLGTHPPNAARVDLVARIAAELRRAP
jgi:Zn-dependent protease with chaperone function